MGLKTFLIGFATVVALCFGAMASHAADMREVTEVSLSAMHAAPGTQVAQATQAPVPLRPSEGMPRYATMNPPSDEPVPQAPAAAPTAKVQVSHEAAAPLPAPPPAATPVARTEQVTVAAARSSDEVHYRLGPGDKLRVTVFNETDLSGDFAIDGQGFVRLPLVGQVQAAGLTSQGLEARIAESFVAGGFLLGPKVSVEIVTYRPFYIIGEVAKPGEYAYVDAMTAPNAIALAGGFTDRAVTATILVRHLGEAKEREVRADQTTHIRPGDVVRVERTAYWSVMTLLSPLISPFATAAYILK